jgi:plasmid maintenance system antidote protein VapI
MPANDAPHPGTILRTLMQAQSVEEFAGRIQVNPHWMSDMLAGRTHMNVAFAERVRTRFPTFSVDFWMRLQLNYEVNMARREALTQALDAIREERLGSHDLYRRVGEKPTLGVPAHLRYGSVDPEDVGHAAGIQDAEQAVQRVMEKMGVSVTSPVDAT